MRYRIRTNGVSVCLFLLDKPFGFFLFVPSAAVRLTRYVRRVRELRQNVESPFRLFFFLTPLSILTWFSVEFFLTHDRTLPSHLSV